LWCYVSVHLYWCVVVALSSTVSVGRIPILHSRGHGFVVIPLSIGDKNLFTSPPFPKPFFDLEKYGVGTDPAAEEDVVVVVATDVGVGGDLAPSHVGRGGSSTSNPDATDTVPVRCVR
jgi:hypothetical protein